MDNLQADSRIYRAEKQTDKYQANRCIERQRTEKQRMKKQPRRC